MPVIPRIMTAQRSLEKSSLRCTAVPAVLQSLTLRTDRTVAVPRFEPD
jgi:hypothetical protein